MFNEFITTLLERDKADDPSPGQAGGEDQDGRYAIQVPEDLNNIYVRLLSGDRATPIEAKNINVPIQPDYPVLVYYVKGIKTPYAIPDPSREAEYRAGNEGLSTVAPHSHEPGQGNYDPVSTIRMREGGVSLSYPYTMTVDIAPLKYFGVDGSEHWFPGDGIDLTDYIPSTSNMHLYCKVALDRINGILTAFPGDEKSILTPLIEDDLAAIEMADQYKPLCGVILRDGMVAIDDMKYITDWRFWIADFSGGGASGVTGVDVEELEDLTDVSSALQMPNFVLVAGDGTGVGDYRGRLLVPNDIPSPLPDGHIPSLNASKITSGVFPHERGGLEVDASSADGYVHIGSGVTSFIKNNITNGNPLATDDSDAGYSVGSQWINTATEEEFVALSVTPAAAVWKSTTSVTSGGVGTFHGVRGELDFTSITNSTPTELPYFATTYDTDNYINVGGDPLLITIPSDFDGYYNIILNLYSSDTNICVNDGTVTYEVQRNGSTIETFNFYYNCTLTVELYTSFSTQNFFNVGDEITIRVTKNTTDDMGFTGFVMVHLLGQT